MPYYPSATTKNAIITHFYHDQSFIKEIKNICKTNDVEDLLAELYTILLHKNEETIVGLNERGELKWYIIRIIISQYFSKTSKYHNLYKKYHHKIVSYDNLTTNENTYLDLLDYNISISKYDLNLAQEDESERIQKELLFIKQELNKLDWYDSKIFSLYMQEDMTYERLSKILKISATSLFKTVTKVKLILKKKYAEKENGK